MFPSHTLAPITAVAVAAVTLSACTADGDEVAAPDRGTSPEPGASATAAPAQPMSPTPTGQPSQQPASEQPPLVPAVDTPELDERCAIDPDHARIEEVRYAVPSSWMVEGRCDVLDPELDELPAETEAEAAIFVSTADVSFREAAAPGGARDVERVWLGARAGYQVSRSTGVSTGEAQAPAGRPSTVYLVDLDAGTDEDGGVLTLTTGVPDGEAYDLARATLDTIADTVVVRPAAEDGPDEGFTVRRTEGGGAPDSVTYDDGCFRLHPGAPDEAATDELCDLDPRDGTIVSGVLGDGTVVGHAPPLAIGVEGATDATVNALTASIEGGSVFALRAVDVPGRLTAIGPGGEDLATAPVG